MEVDPLGAQKEVLDVGNDLGLDIIVSVAYEVSLEKLGKNEIFLLEKGYASLVNQFEKKLLQFVLRLLLTLRYFN